MPVDLGAGINKVQMGDLPASLLGPRNERLSGLHMAEVRPMG